MRGQRLRDRARFGAIRVFNVDAKRGRTIIHRLQAPLLALAALAVLQAGADAATAAPASAPPASVDSLAPLESVREYRPVFEACHDADGGQRLAVRRMVLDARPTLLTVDATTLATSLQDAALWTCAPTDEAAQADTRFGRALRTPTVASNPAVLRNEGIVHGGGDGSFVTGDLCPSRQPLDRAFLQAFERTAPDPPIALSISGLWLMHHVADFRWLQAQRRDGALAITWVMHSFTHPFDPRRPLDRDFLLRPGLDLAHEVLDTERLLIAQGETPSVFFRFPGLVADAALVEALRAYHLVALGADAWLVLSPTLPRPGSIILVHPNGNEPAGLRLFSRYLATGRLSRPFRPVADAP